MSERDRRGRGKAFTAYVPDQTQDEKAFWDAAEEYIDAETGRYKWAAFFRYDCRLVREDRERPEGKMPSSVPGPGVPFAIDQTAIQEQVKNLSKQVQELQRMIQKPGSAVEETELAEEQKSNVLAEKAKNLAGWIGNSRHFADTLDYKRCFLWNGIEPNLKAQVNRQRELTGTCQIYSPHYF